MNVVSENRHLSLLCQQEKVQECHKRPNENQLCEWAFFFTSTEKHILDTHLHPLHKDNGLSCHKLVHTLVVNGVQYCFELF